MKPETTQIDRAELVSSSRCLLHGERQSTLLLAVMRDLDRAEAIVKAANRWRAYTDARGLPYLDDILAGKGPGDEHET